MCNDLFALLCVFPNYTSLILEQVYKLLSLPSWVCIPQLGCILEQMPCTQMSPHSRSSVWLLLSLNSETWKSSRPRQYSWGRVLQLLQWHSRPPTILLKGCCWTVKNAGFLVSRGEEFNPGPKNEAWSLFSNKVLLKYKETEKGSDIDIRRRQKQCSLASVSNGVIYISFTYYSEWKECLEVVKILLDPLP